MSLPALPIMRLFSTRIVLALEVGHAVLADQDEVRAARALPVEEDVAPHGDALVADLAVVAGVAVLHDDEGAGVVAVDAAAAREVVEEDVVLDDHVGDAVDVHVLVGAGLVVEDVALDRDEAGAVVDLQQVVVPGVVEDVVAEDDVLRPVPSGLLHLHHQGAGAGPGVAELEALEDHVPRAEELDGRAAVLEHRAVGVRRRKVVGVAKRS